jgi:hypothetical protein
MHTAKEVDMLAINKMDLLKKRIENCVNMSTHDLRGLRRSCTFERFMPQDARRCQLQSIVITMGVVLNQAKHGINAPTTKEVIISITTIIISLLFWHQEHHTLLDGSESATPINNWWGGHDS